MLERNFIFIGDVTTAGGKVCEGDDKVTWMSRKVAYQGGLITCPECRSVGKIKCVQPFRAYTLTNGHQVALEGDLCICKCRTPPKLLASQNVIRMSFDNHELAALTAAETAVTTSAAAVAVEVPTICLECLAKAAASGAAIVVRI